MRYEQFEVRGRRPGLKMDYHRPVFAAQAFEPVLRGGLTALQGALKGLPPRNRLELDLAGLWEDLLGVAGIGVHDNFFALGGHSLLAVRLVNRIQKTFGVSLPLARLFGAPTLESMADLLRRGGAAPGSLPEALVPLKKGGTLRPLFLIHAGAGHVLSYLALTRGLPDPDRPVFGIQSEIWSGSETPEKRAKPAEIETMAESYVQKILAVQPDGPYHLAGWSLGGVVAFEMARQLEQQGCRVGLLALIDSRAPRFTGAPKAPGELDLLAAFARDLGLSPADLDRAAPIAREKATLSDRLCLLGDLVRDSGFLPPGIEIDELARLFEGYRGNVEAMLRYVPQPFSGSAVLFVAEDSPRPRPEAAKGWAGLIGDLAIVNVPGDHYTVVLPPHVESLAAFLAKAMQDTERESLR